MRLGYASVAIRASLEEIAIRGTMCVIDGPETIFGQIGKSNLGNFHYSIYVEKKQRSVGGVLESAAFSNHYVLADCFV
jgi:hypothetical protein